MVAAMGKRGYRLQDIQVLCPQKQTDVGVYALNYALQAAFNPPAESKVEVFSQRVTIHDENGELKTVSLMLREGDKVVNTANNYEMKFFTWQKGVGFSEDFSRKGIVNGEMGRVAKIMKVKDGKTVRQRVYVQVSSGQFVMYEDNWDDLTLAYAMTIHRRRAASGPSSLRLSCPATARCSTGRSCTHSTPVRRTRPCCMEHRLYPICYRQYSFGQAEHLASGAAPQG